MKKGLLILGVALATLLPANAAFAQRVIVRPRVFVGGGWGMRIRKDNRRVPTDHTNHSPNLGHTPIRVK